MTQPTSEQEKTPEVTKKGEIPASKKAPEVNKTPWTIKDLVEKFKKDIDAERPDSELSKSKLAEHKANNEAQSGKRKTKENGFVRWWPHREAGNRPGINITQNGDGSIESNDLEHFGAYHFEISIFSEYAKSNIQEATNLQKANDMIQRVKRVDTSGSGVGQAISVAKSVAEAGISYLYATVVVGAQIVSGAWDDAMNSDNKNITHVPTLGYVGQSGIKCHIYLPLMNYGTSRNSGIDQTEDVITNIATTIAKGAYNAVSSIGGDVLDIQKHKQGASMRKFVAPRVGAPSLETVDLEWKLVPRNETEMEHIVDILRFFQASSVPSFNDASLFYMMPPSIWMDVITTDHNKNEQVNLRPKRQYYLTKVELDYASENGSTILTPDGYPMFATLRVEMIKATLTSFKELFVNPYM